jgi:hypothetical protein
LEGQIDAYLNRLDYSRADAKKLLADGLWAHLELQKLDQQYGIVANGLQTPSSALPEAEATRLVEMCLDFLGRARSLRCYYLATLGAATREANERINRNQISRYFGLLKLSLVGIVPGVQTTALEQLHRLARGIAARNGWSHPEGREGWRGPTNVAICEELKYFKDLDVPATFEKMIEGRFSVVARAIKNRFIDEFRALKRRRAESPGDPAFENALSWQASPEEQASARSIIEWLESPPETLPSGSRAILRAVAELYRSPRLASMTVSEAREHIVRRASAVANITPQGAGKALRRVAAQQDQLLDELRSLVPRERTDGQRETATGVPE